jgi:hypothetical protein
MRSVKEFPAVSSIMFLYRNATDCCTPVLAEREARGPQSR